MLVLAQKSQVSSLKSQSTRPTFSQGDIRTARVEGKFDCVISLFHVVSYLQENKDVLATFQNAQRHLAPGGVLIFDVWYGPAVASNPPQVRMKKMTGDGLRVTRLCEPVWLPNENRVDVHYHLFVCREGSTEVVELDENHRMRYFSTPELRLFLASSGLVLEESEAWMTGHPASLGTWGVCYIARLASGRGGL